MTATERDTTLSLQAWGVTIPMSVVPMSLSKNGRVYWRTRYRDFQAQKNYVIRVWQCEQSPELRENVQPWERASLFVEWRYALGRHPDDDNAIARVSACRDAFQAIGLVRDDAVIQTAGVTFTRVPRGEESVTVSLRRDE
jgi:hypothetical protein